MKFQHKKFRFKSFPSLSPFVLKYQLTVSPDVAAAAADAAAADADADVAKHQVDREISPLAPRTKNSRNAIFTKMWQMWQNRFLLLLLHNYNESFVESESWLK